jgi:hypothetical protein
MGEAMPHALMDRLGKKLFEEAPLEGYSSNNPNLNTSSNASILSEEDRWLTENDVLQQISLGSQNFVSSTESNLSASSALTGRGASPSLQQSSSSSTKALKRPMLTMRSIQHVRELESFLSHVAQYVYHTTYTLAKPDTKFIEALIERDMLGGSGMEE